MRWPRKNDPASIRARQELLGVDGLVTSIDLEPFTEAAEALTGVAVIPVSVCPIRIELGAYELSSAGDVVETGRAEEDVYVPLAHTEGSMTLSMTRGSTAAGVVKTYVLAGSHTGSRPSCRRCASGSCQPTTRLSRSAQCCAR
jgi:hydroxymethylglutaryl-CoA reductase (NADPH)